MTCPRCGCVRFITHECGDYSWDSYGWIAYSCAICGLWYDDMSDKWYVDIETCPFDMDGEEEYTRD